MEKPSFKKICLLNLQKLTNFPYIEADFDALTDYGMLSKIVEYVNEVITNTNDMTKTIGELFDAFTEIKEYVDKYLVDVEEIKVEIETINSIIEILKDAIKNNENNIVLLREELTSLINSNYDILKEYIDYNDNILNDKITNIQIGEISVYNPTNGLLQPLQIVINDLYGASNKDGLTASEFDALNLTASGFDAYEITAREFDSSGKTILI